MDYSSKSKEPTTLQALMIINLNMHFMKLWHCKTQKASPLLVPSTKFGSVTSYPHLVDCLVHDNGTEFVSAKFQELLQSYGIQSKLTTVENPQANGILKCTHQVIRNLPYSSCLIAQDLHTVADQQELLMSVMWAINTTFHTT
jgi:hypothetical protein